METTLGHIFKTKKESAKARHTFGEEGFMYCWAKFHDYTINFYTQITSSKMAKFKKNLAKKYGLEV